MERFIFFMLNLFFTIKKKPATTTIMLPNYGTHCRINNVRVSTSLAAFKIALKTVQLDNECCFFLSPMLTFGITCPYWIFLSIIFNFYLSIYLFHLLMYFNYFLVFFSSEILAIFPSTNLS